MGADISVPRLPTLANVWFPQSKQFQTSFRKEREQLSINYKQLSLNALLRFQGSAMRCNSDRLPAPPAECTGKGRNRKVVIYKTSNLGNSHPRWKHQWRCLLGHLPSICLLTEFLFMKSVPHSRGQGYRIPRWMVSKWSISSPFSWRPIGGWEKEEHELTVSSLVTRVYFGTVITMASVSSKGYVNRRGNEGGGEDPDE